LQNSHALIDQQQTFLDVGKLDEGAAFLNEATSMPERKTLFLGKRNQGFGRAKTTPVSRRNSCNPAVKFSATPA
jgi:hypothetical protein